MTDNPTIYATLKTLLDARGINAAYYCSPNSSAVLSLGPLDVGSYEYAKGQLIISGHCKQIFPPHVVKTARCVNIHPGLNPYNRGFYPQVFAIMNGTPIGATIHEMDELIDHGPIIDQELVTAQAWDTSKSLYEKVLSAEVRLLHKNIDAILSGNYRTRPPEIEGNYNSLADFKKLCQVPNRYLHAIEYLRALSHPPFNNAYIPDPLTGRKVFVRVELTPEAER
jgi:methionyl-tRNA formyltransferase